LHVLIYTNHILDLFRNLSAAQISLDASEWSGKVRLELSFRDSHCINKNNAAHVLQSQLSLSPLAQGTASDSGHYCI